MRWRKVQEPGNGGQHSEGRPGNRVPALGAWPHAAPGAGPDSSSTRAAGGEGRDRHSALRSCTVQGPREGERGECSHLRAAKSAGPRVHLSPCAGRRPYSCLPSWRDSVSLSFLVYFLSTFPSLLPSTCSASSLHPPDGVGLGYPSGPGHGICNSGEILKVTPRSVPSFPLLLSRLCRPGPLPAPPEPTRPCQVQLWCRWRAGGRGGHCSGACEAGLMATLVFKVASRRRACSDVMRCQEPSHTASQGIVFVFLLPHGNVGPFVSETFKPSFPTAVCERATPQGRRPNPGSASGFREFPYLGCPQ